MKKFTQNLLLIFTALSIVTIVSCGGDNEEIFMVDDDEFDARINNNLPDSLTATVFLDDVDDGSVDVLLSFTSSETMRRVYITRNIQGQGDEKVEADVLFPGADAKGDGSLDLGSASGNGFAFDLSFSTTGLPDEGTVVYNFWATRNKGDFRDPTKDAVTEVATLTIEVTGTNPAAMLKTQQGVQLGAPTGDATSQTFISTLDCEVYKIKSGTTDEENLEFTQFWDFGYYYLEFDGASLSSPTDYPNLFRDPDDPNQTGTPTLPLVNVFEFLGIEATAVNTAYFEKADVSVDFDAITTVGDLEAATTATSSDPQTINDLVVGDVVFVINQYGKNAILKVTEIEPGFNSNDYIVFDIKVEL